MDFLLIIFVSLTILTVASQLALYKGKYKENNGVFLLNIILAISIGYMSYGSFPDNSIVKKAIALVLMLLSIIGLLVRYIGSRNKMLSNILVSVSLVGGLIYLIFGI